MSSRPACAGKLRRFTIGQRDRITPDEATTATRTASRPLALTRKNALPASHDEGGSAWDRIASLTEIA